MEKSEIFQNALGEIFGNPGKVVLGCWEFFLAWLFSRRWLALGWISLPALVVVFLGITGSVGRFGPDTDLLEHYLLLVENDLRSSRDASEEAPELTSDGLLKNEKVSSRAELLLQRILQLDDSNTRATYLVAFQLALRQRFGQARFMMRQIAGESGRGFPPAHAWLAADRLSNLGVTSQAEKLSLLHDLEQAAQWSGTSPLLLSIYSDLLVTENRLGDAIRILEEASTQEPRLWLKLATVAQANKRRDVFEKASERLRSQIEPRIENETASAVDYEDMARLSFLSNDPDQTLHYAGIGLRLGDNQPQLRRLRSEAYRLKYHMTSDVINRRYNLGFLDAALRADDTNPAVTEEIAKLISMGVQATPELQAKLQEKLTSGQATSLTHLLLANRDLVNGNFDPAIAHLEVASRLAPRSPVVLNNLALALSRRYSDDPEKLQRAETLVTRAIQIHGRDAELYDSLGEIRMTANKAVEAVECFEAAIGIDPSRIGTRKKLVKAYRAIGLDDMAELQEELIEKDLAEPEKAPEADDAPASPAAGGSAQEK